MSNSRYRTARTENLPIEKLGTRYVEDSDIRTYTCHPSNTLTFASNSFASVPDPLLLGFPDPGLILDPDPSSLLWHYPIRLLLKRFSILLDKLTL